MKKMTFKIKEKSNENVSFAKILKVINEMSCKINFDLENNRIYVEDIDEISIENVIEIICENYTVLGVEIDNVKSSDPKSNEITVNNKCISESVKKLVGTCNWAINNIGVDEKNVCEYVWDAVSKISMRYNPNPVKRFYVGDVVECNFGAVLSGEIGGVYVNAVVCNINSQGLPYVLPILYSNTINESNNRMIVDVKNDFTRNLYKESKGIVILDKGQYISPERFRKVISKVKPEVMKIILEKLKKQFDFTNNINSNVNVTDVQPQKIKRQKCKDDVGKMIGAEAALVYEHIKPALNKIKSYATIPEKVQCFLYEIGMLNENIENSEKDTILKEAFLGAMQLGKINYQTVIEMLHGRLKKIENVNHMDDKTIKNILQISFKEWLAKDENVGLKELCPKISMGVLLKAFAYEVKSNMFA